MNVKDFSISLCRAEVTLCEDCSAPSLVDPTIHNPSLQEIIERFTRTGELIVSEHTPYYNGEDAEMSALEDITDLFENEGSERNEIFSEVSEADKAKTLNAAQNLNGEEGSADESEASSGS